MAFGSSTGEAGTVHEAREAYLAWLVMRCPLHRHLVGSRLPCPALLGGPTRREVHHPSRRERDSARNICMEYRNFLCVAGVGILALRRLLLSCGDSPEGLRGTRELGAGKRRGTRSRGTGKLQLRLEAYRGSIPHAVGELPLRGAPFGVSLSDGSTKYWVWGSAS